MRAWIALLRWAFYVSVLAWAWSRHFFSKLKCISLLVSLYSSLGRFYFLYPSHRVDHYCRIFWAVHVTHHSSKNLIVNRLPFLLYWPTCVSIYLFRTACVFRISSRWISWFMYSITQTSGILVHTKYINKMPRLVRVESL